MRRRDFLRNSTAAPSGAALAGSAGRGRTETGRKPDILFFFVEDVSPKRFGCWGNKVCRTPNIDKLAASGVRFDLAHTNAAPCNPSRTALLTCRRPESTGVYGNNHDWRKMIPGVLTMPRHLKDNGYQTVRIGKVFHGGFEDDASWSRVINPREGLPEPKNRRRPLKGPGVEFAMRRAREGDAAKPLAGEGASGSPFMWGPSGQTDDEMLDGMVAAQAIKVLEQKQDRPLFLAIGEHATHLPFTAPDKYFDLYPPEKIELPEPPPRPKDRVGADQKALTQETWREVIAAQYACLSFVDAQVGKVLDALERTGRAGNTIVIFWSDHGFSLGEHYLWRKGPLYNESALLALIMRAPGVTKPGSVCKRPVESGDLFPTLFDLSGIPQPAGIEAFSMLPLLKDPSRPWKKGAITCQGPKGRSLCTERYRYTEYAGEPDRTELFDHDADPGEHKNLARDATRADVVRELSALLKGGWKACLPAAG